MDRLSAPMGRITVALALALACGFATAADAPKNTAAATTQPAPKRVYFATPEDGFSALVAALRKPDFKAVDRLLGPGHQRITDSGDSAADREAARNFVGAYEAKHAIQATDTQAVLSIGDSDWPMPIRLVKQGPD